MDPLWQAARRKNWHSAPHRRGRPRGVYGEALSARSPGVAEDVDGGTADRLGAGSPAVAQRALKVLVVDASVALFASSSPDGFQVLGTEPLAAPPLLWSETRSALHEQLWRRQISERQALATLDALANAPIREDRHPGLNRAAWRIADRLGWAKTYDAEYVALAELLGCRLATLDQRLRRGATRLGFVVLLNEL